MNTSTMAAAAAASINSFMNFPGPSSINPGLYAAVTSQQQNLYDYSMPGSHGLSVSLEATPLAMTNSYENKVPTTLDSLFSSTRAGIAEAAKLSQFGMACKLPHNLFNSVLLAEYIILCKVYF